MTDTATDQTAGLPRARSAASDFWVIVDGDGLPVGPPWDDRAAALRHMGILAGHGARLPLVLHGPDGRPTGDRLP